ncbi:GPW/gp25 family protein [Roseibium sp. MMSF_3544]|uniref:GPW/gp25 family protein n=1 Tax=unclassified Roseibium TaxID=2629323 RepID=UPI00273E56A1|nr:GPW/gp25 family protein [Roseibium sp. MMSF_3544]
MAVEDRFIGTGWSFPPTFENGAVQMTDGVQNIRESLRIILTTTLGERVMRPDFGCRIKEEIFGPMNSTRLTMIETVIRRAILLHEPRVEAKRVAVEARQAEGILEISLDYEIRGAKSRFSLVLPYELEAAL